MMGGGGCGGGWGQKGGKGGGGGGVKAGDWICPGCGDHQYARNDECRKCSTPKPTEGLVQISSNSQLKPGDWICPGCGDHQFGRNEECKQCGTAKPEGCVVAKAEMKEGDWICPQCEDHQFAKKHEVPPVWRRTSRGWRRQCSHEEGKGWWQGRQEGDIEV